MMFVPDLMPLAALVAETEGASLVRGNPSTPIRGVAYDSRRVEPGDVIYVAERLF